MDTAMRDLEQIQERDPEAGAGRRAATVALAALATVSLVFAMGVLLAEGETQDEPVSDPLLVLDQAAGLEAQPEVEEDEDLVPQVDRQALTFPSTLGEEDRPEVNAAFAAAAAEHAHLGAPSPERSLTAVLPAAVAVGPGGEALGRAVREDPMVAAAMPGVAPASRPAAGEGMDGRYTLQVISYHTPDEAEVFADALRGRGHQAFVMRADIPGRGTYFRVRIGPFESLRDANEYRATFEQEERMNTFVVKRRDDD